MEIEAPEEPQVNLADESVANEAKPDLSSDDTAIAGDQPKLVRTLVDAVKPKHKRKKKTASNTR